MAEAEDNRSTPRDTTGPRVYIPAPLWRALLESLKATKGLFTNYRFG